MNDKKDINHFATDLDSAFIRTESLIELALDIAREEGDGSFPSPLEQLVWRIEDLELRLAELSENHCGVFSFNRISEEEIECVLPKYFSNTRDVLKAIEIAEQRLIRLIEEYENDTEAERQEHSCLQLEFADMVSSQAA